MKCCKCYESSDSFRRLVHFVRALLAGCAPRIDSLSHCLAFVAAAAPDRHHDRSDIRTGSGVALSASPPARVAKGRVPPLMVTPPGERHGSVMGTLINIQSIVLPLECTWLVFQTLISA